MGFSKAYQETVPARMVAGHGFSVREVVEMVKRVSGVLVCLVSGFHRN
jgi:hypothetical protein